MSSRSPGSAGCTHRLRWLVARPLWQRCRLLGARSSASLAPGRSSCASFLAVTKNYRVSNGTLRDLRVVGERKRDRERGKYSGI